MKAAVISDYLPGFHRTWSGAEIIASSISDMLKGRDCEVFFATTPFDFSPNRPARVFEVRTPLKRLGTVSRNFPLDAGAISGLRGLLKREKPDVVHINAKYLFLPAMIASMSLDIPTVFTVPDYFILCPTTSLKTPGGEICDKNHGAWCMGCITGLNSGRDGMEGLLHGAIKRIPKWMLSAPFYARARQFDYFIRKVGAFVVLSKESKKRMVGHGIPEEKVRQIYHYIPSRPDETAERITNPSVFFAGKLCEENGTHILLEAFAIALRKVPNAKLYLAGWAEEPFRRVFNRLIEALGITNRVEVFEKKKNPEILAMIAKSDIVVVPHQWPKEFGPVILIEAVAMGKPVITSAIGGTGEFVSDGVSGHLIKEYGRPSAFAEKIAGLLSEPHRAREMGQNGKERVSFLFDGSQTDKLLDLYKSLIT